MYTSSNIRGYESGQNFKHSRSSDNFYRKATERSLKFQSAISTAAADCLACKHEQEKQTFRASKSPNGFKNIYLNSKASQEEYYKTNQKDELQHLRKTKRYLEQLLERSKNDHKKSIVAYQTRLTELNQKLTEKSNELLELQRLQNRKQAENCYLANASLVRSYKQMQLQDQDQEQNRARKIKELVRKTTQLEEELSDARQSVQQKRLKIQSLELQLTKMKDFQFYQREYEAMKLLIGKMEEQKLQLLDRQHNQIEEMEQRHRIELEDQRVKNEELRQQLEEKMFKLTDAQRQLHTLRHNFTQFKNQQYESLRELLQEREKECHSLQSRLNCIESELTFVRGRYGYLLRLAQSGQLVDSIVGEQEDFCIERIGRYNISNGKQSLMSMNLSPIKRR